jgi:hypothetical protein
MAKKVVIKRDQSLPDDENESDSPPPVSLEDEDHGPSIQATKSALVVTSPTELSDELMKLDLSDKSKSEKYTIGLPSFSITTAAISKLFDLMKSGWTNNNSIPWNILFSIDPVTQQFLVELRKQIGDYNKFLTLTDTEKEVIRWSLIQEAQSRNFLKKDEKSNILEKIVPDDPIQDHILKAVGFLDFVYLGPAIQGLNDFRKNSETFRKRKLWTKEILTIEQAKKLLSTASHLLPRLWKPFSDYAFALIYDFFSNFVLVSSQSPGRPLRKAQIVMDSLLIQDPERISAIYNASGVWYGLPSWKENQKSGWFQSETKGIRYLQGIVNIFIASPLREIPEDCKTSSKPVSLNTTVAYPLSWVFGFQRLYPKLHFTTFVPEEGAKDFETWLEEQVPQIKSSLDTSQTFTWSWNIDCKSTTKVKETRYCANSPNGLIYKIRFSELLSSPLVYLANLLTITLARPHRQHKTVWNALQKVFVSSAPNNYQQWLEWIQKMAILYSGNIFSISSGNTEAIPIIDTFTGKAMKLDFGGPGKDPYTTQFAAKWTKTKPEPEETINNLLHFLKTNEDFWTMDKSSATDWLLLSQHLNALVDPIIVMHIHQQIARFLGTKIETPFENAFADKEFSLFQLYPEGRVFTLWGPEFLVYRYYQGLLATNRITRFQTGILSGLKFWKSGQLELKSTCTDPQSNILKKFLDAASVA